MRLHDLDFEIFISAAVIQERVKQMASELHSRFQHKDPVFVIILKGSFIFGADLVRAYPGKCEVVFTRVKSYSGTEAGAIQLFSGFDETVRERDIIIIEDIVDSGKTVFHLQQELAPYRPTSVTIVALLQKKILRPNLIKADIAGFEIPDVFVVGCGLDYDELGRNLPDVYAVVQ